MKRGIAGIGPPDGAWRGGNARGTGGRSVQPHGKPDAGRQNPSPDAHLLELPQLGEVVKAEEERGFGFISMPSGGTEVFFHTRGRVDRRDGVDRLPSPGTRVLFMLARDPRKPDKPNKVALRWCSTAAIPSLGGKQSDAQVSVDALRRERLQALPWEALWHLLRAGWYSRLWKGFAPPDLEDSVLESVLGARLPLLTAEELAANDVRGNLLQCRYKFAARWLPEHPDCAPAELATLFEPRQLAVLGMGGSSLLVCNALAIDLETDGEHIWEIGCARAGKASLLHDERRGTSLPVALAELAKHIRATPLLVGHNVLAWDWPILSRLAEVPSCVPIWDTLLVQYLMEPQARSHALGGNHHADGDALACSQLFERQLRRLPSEFADAVLAGEFQDASQLMDAMTQALRGVVSLAREAPALLNEAGSDATRLLIMPESRLSALDWVPDVCVVSADPAEGLPHAWRQIDVDALEHALQGECSQRPIAKLVLAVARMAAEQRIALRRNMLPLWLLEADETVASAIEQACSVPKPGDGRRVAPLPSRAQWWRETDPAVYCLSGVRQDVLVLDYESGVAGDVDRLTSEWPAASLVRDKHEDGEARWLVVDRAAYVLDPHAGVRSFRTLQLKDRQPAPTRPVLASRPVLAMRLHHVLHPGSQDQAAYWMEVLRTFRELGQHTDRSLVPILLVGSSASSELLQRLGVGLAEIDLGEVRPAHRSRREHMLRASRRGYALVDFLDQWPHWQSLARQAGIVLKPVVEALPVEQWYACSESHAPLAASSPNTGDPGNDEQSAPTLTTGTEAGSASTALTHLFKRLAGQNAAARTRTAASSASRATRAATGTEPLAIGAAAILERLPLLAAEWLPQWLCDSRLDDVQEPVVLIDPRVCAIGRGLTSIADLTPLRETALSADETARLDVVFSSFKLVREDAPSDYASMERFLVNHWQPKDRQASHQVTGFKETQRSAMEAICSRSCNVLVSLPTGEGKSVLFQVPALCRGLRNRRLTLVLSPLKALMRDQVERLREQGFAESADYLSSDRPAHETAEVMQGVLDHRIVLLYVAPERLRSVAFLDVLSKRMQADAGLEHVVVDEAHCVNQWGYEFRPDYFHAFDLLLRKCLAAQHAGPTPFLLLSATITASDKERLAAIITGPAVGQAALPLVARPEAFASPIRSHIAIQPRRVHGRLTRKDFDKALAERLPAITQAIVQARQNRERTAQRSAVIVFVSTRAHAEDLAQRLAASSGARVDYYHAGLDAGAREEVYERFHDGALDVLVATKAFGMGMDIPDIHWVIHLSPPGYLEDYLQEVGRVGRGVAERERAGLSRLSAVLPFSSEDFEHIRSQRASNALSFHAINDVYRHIRENVHEVDGQLMAVVPHVGYEPPESDSAKQRAAATRTRLALYWLERAGRLELCGSISDLLTLTLHPQKLVKMAAEEDGLGELARMLLDLGGVELYEDRRAAPPRGMFATVFDAGSEAGGFRQASDSLNRKAGLLGRLLGGLADMVGLTLGAPAQRTGGRGASSERQGYAESPSCVAVINLSQIRFRSNVTKTNDDILSGLADIEKRGGVSLNREIQFALRGMASEPVGSVRALFNQVDGAVKELIRRLSEKGRIEFNPLTLIEQGAGLAVADDTRQPMYARAFLNGFRALSRASGVRLRQIIGGDEKAVWEAMLAPSQSRKADVRRTTVRNSAQLLFGALKNTKTAEDAARSIPVSTLIKKVQSASTGQRFREQDLRQAAALLSAMNLVSLAVDLVPLSHVVLLSKAAGSLSDDSYLWQELKQVNELAEARNLAMEVFANLRQQAQESFIEGYFSKPDASQLKAFLESQLGEIDAEDSAGGVPAVIADMREQLRASKAIEFFETFKRSEEPAQWQAVRHPYDQHLLVNAGPGAGKTFVLVGRIAHLIREQHIDPSQIIVLAFNRAVVFEIKRRIRELFKSLGYAAYAARLRVSTFHSFAIRHLAEEGRETDGTKMEDLLMTFSKRMASEPGFRRTVAGGVRSILVDEFQDVTDEVYDIVHGLYLGSESRAGVMVIGDDDQDILRWQRKAGDFSEKYFDRFTQDFGSKSLASLVLRVNFRSGKEIVEHSQHVISNRLKRNPSSRRLKDSLLAPRSDAPSGALCDGFDWRNRSLSEAVNEAVDRWMRIERRNEESLAVLCRSNAEVAEVHRLLESRIPGVSVQGMANLRIAGLRHIGLWLDYLREALQSADRALTLALKAELLDGFRRQADIPEVLHSQASDIQLETLWDLCCLEQAFPHVSSLIDFIEDLRSDDLGRLSGAGGSTAQTVVSTIHKVKGLEFDNVIILPSSIPFGKFGRDDESVDVAGDAAEEIRLMYVAMTRAKRRVLYFLGDREYSWAAQPAPYAGQRAEGRVLVGSPEDVGLSWALAKNVFNVNPEQCQAYIERQVRVGDRIMLGGVGTGANKALMHQSASGEVCQIGFLAKKHGAGGSGASLQVSAVIRFRPEDLDDAGMASSVVRRGWGYVVLVSGRLR